MSANQVAKQIQVVSQSALNPNQVSEKAALFDENGDPLAVSADAVTAATLLLTGYTVGSPVDLAAADSVTAAFGKVQALIYNLISRVEALENP